MIPMRHYPDRTLRINIHDLTVNWEGLGHSEYCIRRPNAWTIEIKHSDDIEWDDEE